jgi:hypothetical protein
LFELHSGDAVLIVSVIGIYVLYLWATNDDRATRLPDEEEEQELTACVQCGGEYALVKVTSAHRRLLRWYECEKCHAQAMRSAPNP